jgi:hypothetical protein
MSTQLCRDTHGTSLLAENIGVSCHHFCCRRRCHRALALRLATPALPPVINDYLSICGWCQTGVHSFYIARARSLGLSAAPTLAHYFSTQPVSPGTKLITICAQINNTYTANRITRAFHPRGIKFLC